MSKTTKSKQKIFYCYALCDPRKPKYVNKGPRTTLHYEPFYIGYGHEDRCYQHVKHASKTNNNNPKDNKIRKILKSGKDVVIVKSSLTTMLVAKAREIELIAAYGRKNMNLGPLVNLTDGGEGGHGLKHSEKSKNKMSAAKIGHVVLESTRRKLSLSNIGKTHTRETKEKIREASTGRKHSDETKELLRAMKTGLSYSAKARKRMSDAHVGITMSETHKENMRIAQIKRRERELKETKGAGIKRSAEAREKMRLAALRRHGKS